MLLISILEVMIRVVPMRIIVLSWSESEFVFFDGRAVQLSCDGR